MKYAIIGIIGCGLLGAGFEYNNAILGFIGVGFIGVAALAFENRP